MLHVAGGHIIELAACPYRLFDKASFEKHAQNNVRPAVRSGRRQLLQNATPSALPTQGYILPGRQQLLNLGEKRLRIFCGARNL